MKMIFSLLFLFSTKMAFGQSTYDVCTSADKKLNQILLNKMTLRFLQETMAVGFTKESDKGLKNFQNMETKIYSNPKDHSEKVVYIEYDKDWWGKLYFAKVEKASHEIKQWTPIKTYGAIVKCVKWENAKNFLYWDSTHQGTKTKNSCSITGGISSCVRVGEAYR